MAGCLTMTVVKDALLVSLWLAGFIIATGEWLL